MADPPRPPDEKPPLEQEGAVPGGDAPADGTHVDQAEPHKPKPEEPQVKAMPEKSELFPADNPAVTKHVDVLQGIITRLANNSASCKTWCLTLVGAVLSLAGGTKMPVIGLVVIVPILIFRYLDIKYLATEKSFRDKYDAIIALVRSGTYAREHLFDIKPDTRPEALAAVERHARTSWSVQVYRRLIVLYWVYVAGYALYLVAWLIDWNCGLFGGFLAASPAPTPAVK
jgi:hypothetical protein